MHTLFAAALSLALVSTPAASPEATPEPLHEECVAVPEPLLDWISEGILPETEAELPFAWMVKSDDFENVWFVAGDLDGPELDDPDNIALWATNGPAEDGTYEDGDGGLVLSVDGYAKEFTDWFDAETRDVSRDDDGADTVLECAEATAEEDD